MIGIIGQFVALDRRVIEEPTDLFLALKLYHLLFFIILCTIVDVIFVFVAQNSRILLMEN